MQIQEGASVCGASGRRFILSYSGSDKEVRYLKLESGYEEEYFKLRGIFRVTVFLK